MKKESTTTMRSAINYFFSLTLLCTAAIFYSSCDGYMDFDLGTWNFDAGFNGTGVWNPAPGYIYVDSVVMTPDDSITLRGHFEPATLAKDIQIKEYGFVVFDYSENKRITLRSNETWHFDSPDTVVEARCRIAQIKANMNVQVAVYYIYTDQYGVETYVQSDYALIKEFVPSLIAVHDSITVYNSNQVILWGHLETTEDCKLLDVTVRWGYRFSPNNFDQINVPEKIKAGDIIAVADTIDVTPNTFYEWYISATAEFSNDSTNVTPYAVNEFMTGN